MALDYPAPAPAMAMAKRLRGCVRTLKIGSVLFTVCGPDVIRRVRGLGFEVMLDLKFFDIPSTVEWSCRAAVRHRVSMVTVHASGGCEMLEAAVRGVRAEAARQRLRRPLVLAVTVLTSAEEAGSRAVRARVLRLAQTARAAGCDGVVASVQEATALRRCFGRRFRIVCPGIRPACAAPQGASISAAGRPSGTPRGDLSPGAAHSGSSRAKPNDDQRRVGTPAQALADGADALVVGRPITAARDPMAAVRTLLSEMEGSCHC